MKKKKAKDSKKVTIGKGIKVKRGTEAKLKKKAGGSNVGEYKRVAKSDFAGKSGGAPEGSYPINTKKRARAALAYAHNAPNPAGIRKAVLKKYPSLKKAK
jgi:type IV secretory pathway TrbL component